MSHFSVLVVTTSPREEEIAAALAPYQENNMGNCPREYLEFLDIEDERRKEHEEKTADVAFNPAGEFRFIWDDMFWRKASEEEVAHYDSLSEDERKERYPEAKEATFPSRTLRLLELPEGWERKTAPLKELWPSFDEFMSKWHGMERDAETGRYGYWSNPNTKWDYWTIGGRWNGSLRHKTRVRVKGVLEGRCNQCLVDDLDLDRMLEDARQERAEYWDQAEKEYLKKPVDGMPFTEAARLWDEKRAALDERFEQEGRKRPMWELVEEDPVALSLRSSMPYYSPRGMGDRDAYINGAVPISVYAILHDGKWMANGEMGWFGLSNDDMTEEEWRQMAMEIVRGLDPDLYVTMVDCHI